MYYYPNICYNIGITKRKVVNMPNPILSKVLSNEGAIEGQTMTKQGAILKSCFLFIIITLSAIYTCNLAFAGFMDKVNILMMAGGITALISGLIAIIFKPKITPLLAIIYSVGEGFLLGGISMYFENFYHGIVLSAVMLTFIVLGVMLFLYVSRLIQVNEKFRSVVTIATASVLVIYLIQLVASFFGRSIPLIFSNGGVGIGFSMLIILIAALNLLVDFNIIEEGETYNVPKLYEWISALGLMFSLVWLYVEILNLLAKLNSRN